MSAPSFPHHRDAACDASGYDGNVETADVVLKLTEGEPWQLPLRWEADDGSAINIASDGWDVSAMVRLPEADRPVVCAKTEPLAGWFELRLTEADVDALPLAKPGHLIVTVGDPDGRRFHFRFPVIRRPL